VADQTNNSISYMATKDGRRIRIYQWNVEADNVKIFIVIKDFCDIRNAGREIADTKLQ